MKKTEYITFRTNEAVKRVLADYAADKKWTISFAVEQIIQEWVEKQSSTKQSSSGNS